MEAGYDYTLLGSRPQGNGRYMPALMVAVLAGVLLLTGLAYYGFASNAEADQVALAATAASADAGVTADSGDTVNAVKYTHVVARPSIDEIGAQELYPAGFSDPEHWVNPLGFEE
ncbi:MAG: hypothetical protein OXE17_09550 [Chloroflexi bacterium]|nr:hypothetical protein [Chloroflexota bacterium]